MREILFRGKQSYNQEWVEGFYARVGKKHYIVSVFSEHVIDWYEVDPSTIGQYIGLKNKHGKRIFEGDIVQRRREIATVEYDEFNCSCCNGVYGWTFDGGDIREGDEYEIVGNIHDNPELLRRCD